MENQYKIRTNATLCKVLLLSFRDIILFPLLASLYGWQQSLSKTAFKILGQIPILTQPLFLIHKCRKGSRKPRLRYNTRGLIVTSRFWLNIAILLGVILSELLSKRLSCPLFCNYKNIQDKSCINLITSIIKTYSISKMVTSPFLSQRWESGVFRRIIKVSKVPCCAPSCLRVLPGFCHRLRLARPRNGRIFCRKIGVRSSRKFAGPALDGFA